MGRVPILLTQGPYRGRALRDLSNEELDHAGETCPRWNPQFADSVRQVRAEVQRRVIAQRRRATEASRRTQQEAAAAREAQREAREAREAQREAEVASVVASMTPDERARYDAADAARRRRLLAAVRAHLVNEARRAEHARQEAARATWTAAYRAAHPDADAWEEAAARHDWARGGAKAPRAGVLPHTEHALALAIIAAGRKGLARTLHPDIGGDGAAMAQINATADRLEQACAAW
jgi:hypothetical protein